MIVERAYTKFLVYTTFAISAAFVSPGLSQSSIEKQSELKIADKIKDMSPEERAAFHKKRTEKWKAMPKEEKIQMIEKRRKERIKHMDEKWNGMSDDEKINYVEKKMQRKKTRAVKKRATE